MNDLEYKDLEKKALALRVMVDAEGWKFLSEKMKKRSNDLLLMAKSSGASEEERARAWRCVGIAAELETILAWPTRILEAYVAAAKQRTASSGKTE